ncbi:hypothetical protein BOW28_11510 [Solemya velum gill symbiont]|uniref:Methylase n=2 Tax=Solemya velum gill symbiont TaxID=2340 RepID=A0A0B0H4C0_SOVGS|nr:methylase [Solemya velum gill symbiont]OOY69708.1 hypothetical protein BOW08_12285 [Solemya velum gill symbiont]OOY92600.1 hypothetical protein BOW17_12315 [Solemya velum gill symbiont]OOZ16076.1 hypothetical protein BOW28_11510 [Solemya velum gill symbiont]
MCLKQHETEMNKDKQSYFDKIAHGYKALSTDLTPIRSYSEVYTLLKRIGDINGKEVLHVACSDGYFSRLIKQAGAKSLLGVDLSPNMIAIAEQHEKKSPLGITYQVADVFSMELDSRFDILFSSFAMSYATTRDQLLKMCVILYERLKPGGKLISMNDHPELKIDCETGYQKYGKTKRIIPPVQDGANIEVTWIAPDENNKLSEIKFKCHYFTRDAFIDALTRAGFVDIKFNSPEVSPEGLELFGESYWTTFLSNPLLIFIEAQKPY